MTTDPKFHITKSGTPDVCDAKARACPLGGEHYDSIQDAMRASLRQDLGTAAGADDPFADSDERVAYQEQTRREAEEFNDEQLMKLHTTALMLNDTASAEVYREILSERS